jgi:hypothetical protein
VRRESQESQRFAESGPARCRTRDAGASEKTWDCATNALVEAAIEGVRGDEGVRAPRAPARYARLRLRSTSAMRSCLEETPNLRWMCVTCETTVDSEMPSRSPAARAL